MPVFRMIRRGLAAAHLSLRALIAADIWPNRFVPRRVPVPVAVRPAQDRPQGGVRK